MSKIFIDTHKNPSFDDLVILHEDCFPASRLSLLGRAFLRFYYKSIIPECTVVTAHKKGEVIGFILGNTVNLNFFRIFSLKLVIKCIIHILHNPKIILNIFYELLKRLTLKKLECNKLQNCSIELSHFAVSTLHQNLGVGTELVISFEKIVREAGYRHVHTRTHSHRLMQHYVAKKAAKIIEYDERWSSYWIVQWDVK